MDNDHGKQIVEKYCESVIGSDAVIVRDPRGLYAEIKDALAEAAMPEPEAQPQGGELKPCPFCKVLPVRIEPPWFEFEHKTGCYLIVVLKTHYQRVSFENAECWDTRADLPRATADMADRDLIEAIAEPWICVEENPCEETVAVHWEALITALTAGLSRAASPRYRRNNSHPVNPNLW